MKSYLFKNATLVCPEGIIAGWLWTEGGKIRAVGKADESLPTPDGELITLNLGGALLTPGFVDIHTHGGGGCDFMDEDPSAMLTAARAHLIHGTTSLLATSCTSTNEALFTMFDNFRRAEGKNAGGARLLGIHLEGPYLSPLMKGAMLEELLTDPLPEYYEPVLEAGEGIIRRWTVAPERNGALAFSDLLEKKNILVSAGHTAASPALMKEASAHGFTLATHLYNAMTAMHKEGIFRVAGAAEGALSNDAFDIEVVADGIHQPHEILNIAWRVKGPRKMALITDALAIAGLPVPPDGISHLGGRKVLIEDGVCKLADRSAISGSVATGDRLLREALAAGIPLWDAVTMLSATPARMLGEASIGALVPGRLADLVIWKEDLTVEKVFKGGEEISL